MNLLIGNASGTAVTATLLFGDQQASLPTPFGGSLLNNAVVPIGLGTLAPGGASVSLGLPNRSAFCGAELYCQLIHIDPGASAGIAFSRGLRLVLGQQ